MKEKLPYEQIIVEILLLAPEDVITTSTFKGEEDTIGYAW